MIKEQPSNGSAIAMAYFWYYQVFLGVTTAA